MVRKTYKGIIQIIFIFMAVWILFYILGEGNPNLFLYDDNASQWLPVINSIFDNFITTGKINYWNYYLMGGINILDTGIYSILNPIMFIAYLVFRVFRFSNTITIYIYLIMCIALIVYNSLLSRLGIGWRERACFLVCVSGCTAYYRFGKWYYVFNNILIGALLMGFFLLYDEKKKCSYFAAGGILAFSLYLGNAQYTVYWYMAFAIVCFGLFLQKKYYFVKIFIINIVVALVLSIPQIIMNYHALNNNFLGDDGYYYLWNLDLGNFVVHSMIPDGVFSKLFVEGTYSYQFQGMYFVGILPLAIVMSLYLIHRKKETYYIEKLCLAYIVAAAFFLVYSLGKKGVLATFLRHFPVLNSFRWINKPYFVFVQLAMLPLVFICMKVTKHSALLLIGTCLAVVNIMCSKCAEGGYITGTSYVSEYDGLDFENYRVMAILEERGKVNNLYYDEKLLLRNYPAFFKVYSIGAYNLSYSSEQYALVNRLMNRETINSEYAYANATFADSFVLDDESTKQLVTNSVKYIFTDSENILSEFKQRGLLATVYEVDSGIWLFEVAGVKPLALSGSEKVNVTNLGNELLLDISNCLNDEEEIKLSFSYNESYKAYYINLEEEKIFCNISPDEDGYVVIHYNGNPAGKVYLSYSDVWSVLAIGVSVLSDFFLLYSLWCLFGVNKISRIKWFNRFFKVRNGR